jgi:hypothetical protein
MSLPMVRPCTIKIRKIRIRGQVLNLELLGVEQFTNGGVMQSQIPGDLGQRIAVFKTGHSN